MKLISRDVIIIIQGIIGLFLLFKISQNGRYQSLGEGSSVLDTSNGKFYTLERNGNNNPEIGPIFKWKIQSEEVK